MDRVDSPLLAAALSGLLCFAACDGDDDVAPPGGEVRDASVDATHRSDGDAPIVDAASEVSDAGARDADADDASADDASADASAVDASDASRAHVACDDPVPSPQILSSETVSPWDQQAFTALCDERGGWVQVHPHCGGANSCRGFSYDSDTNVWTEHTCRAVNTCTGFSCIVCDP